MQRVDIGFPISRISMPMRNNDGKVVVSDHEVGQARGAFSRLTI
jgi:hypothetical protein